MDIPALAIETRSPEATFELGRDLGRLLRGGDVLGLSGDLGAGKTQLVRGLAAGLAIHPEVIYSPTFTLVAEHEGRLKLNHIDLFRLGDPVSADDEEAIGLGDYLDPPGVTAVEWHEKLRMKPESWTLRIRIDSGEGDKRTIHLVAPTARGGEIIEAMKGFISSPGR